MEENKYKNMTTDDIASLLVQLYADFTTYSGFKNVDYAHAVGVAIRMLTD